MCRYTYHHYPICGHISSFTVDGCPEFTNRLRAFASTGQSISCGEAKIIHDLLPVSQPSACVECEREWREMISRAPPEFMRPQANARIEGLDATNPIFRFLVCMTLDEDDDAPTTDSVKSGDEMCDIFLDISREHDRSWDHGGSDEVSRTRILSGENDILEDVKRAVKPGYTSNELFNAFDVDLPAYASAQPEMFCAVANTPITLFETVSMWLGHLESGNEQDLDRATQPGLGEHLDLLGELPIQSQVVRPGFHILADANDEMSTWLDQFDVGSESVADDTQPDIGSRRIDMLEDLPSRGKLITDLSQALKTTPPATDPMEFQSSTFAEQVNASGTVSTQPSDTSSVLWLAGMSRASFPKLPVREEPEDDEYDWLPSRKMPPIPRISGILWSLPLKGEQDADDQSSEPLKEDYNQPATDRPPTPFVPIDETPEPGARRRYMAAISESEARAQGLRFPMRIGGLYAGF